MSVCQITTRVALCFALAPCSVLVACGGTSGGKHDMASSGSTDLAGADLSGSPNDMSGTVSDAAMSGDGGTGVLPSAVAAKVVTGLHHSCALTTTGAVRCWGYPDHGQVGNAPIPADTADIVAIDAPVQVVGLTSGVVDISAGDEHTCAVLSTGAIKCWGANESGELGDGTTNDSGTPVAVTGISNAKKVACGFQHTCLLDAAGAVKCWGDNTDSQLGADTPSQSSTPLQIPTLTSGVTAITSGGKGHSCAITSAGAAMCWGDNDSGQLGISSTDGQGTPMQVTGLTTGVTAISAGLDFTCAVVSGAAKCWGFDEDGELGDNGTGAGNQHTSPVAVTGLSSGVTSIAAGGHVACAVVSGAAKCWGDGTSDGISGGIGNGADLDEPTNVPVTGLTTGVASVAAGDNAVCALLSNGAIKCWGSNDGGQLGDGKDGTQQAESESNVPVAVISFP